ncbi:MAG: HD domain-containing protein [Candidatus Falkowbacteria bacterium]
MKITKKIIQQIEQEARDYFNGASCCHDWTHVERVKTLALKIGKKEKADFKILEIAALLHDIGRRDEMKNKGSFCHAERGAEMAEQMLKKYKLDKEITDNILHCVKTHRYRNLHKPKTIEAKVLFDSDKLDSIGAMGIARIFLFAGSMGSKNLYTGNEKKLAKENKSYSYTKEDSAFLEYEVKLKYIKNKMLTKGGRKMAKSRDDFMKKYFKIFWQEVGGKK